jgi:hypothetical protein
LAAVQDESKSYKELAAALDIEEHTFLSDVSTVIDAGFYAGRRKRDVPGEVKLPDVQCLGVGTIVRDREQDRCTRISNANAADDQRSKRRTDKAIQLRQNCEDPVQLFRSDCKLSILLGN